MKPQPPVMMHLGRFTASARATVSDSTLAENSRTALTTRSHSASPSHQPTGRQTISSASVLSWVGLGLRLGLGLGLGEGGVGGVEEVGTPGCDGLTLVTAF